MIKSRRMRWSGHVARIGEKRNSGRLSMGESRRKEATKKTKTYVDWIILR
jgi:hypothetical protein